MTAWWWRATEGQLVPDHPPVDVTGRVATTEGLPCGRWCINTPAGPCDEQCIEDWIAEQSRKANGANEVGDA